MKTMWVFLVTAYRGFRPDLSTCAYCSSPFLILFLFESVSGKRLHEWIYSTFLIIELTAIFLISISDPELFIQWGNKFNQQVLVYITHPREMMISSASVHWLKTILFSLVFITLIVFIFKRMKKIFGKERDLKLRHIVYVLLIGAVNFIMIRGGVGVATISPSYAIYSSKHIYNATALNSLWNAMYYIVNDNDALYRKGFKFEDTERAKALFTEQIRFHSDSMNFLSTSKPNIIIVILESFTATGSSFFGYKENCMPHLDRIASEGLSFMQCYASGDRTDKGLVSVLSGYPSQPLSSIIIFPDKVKKLPGLGPSLKKAGYSSTFFYGGDVEFASMKSYLLMQDFDRILDRSSFTHSQLNSKWGAHDGNLYDKVLNTLNAYKEPFLTSLLTLSSHDPFDVPYQSKLLPRDDWYRYKNSLLYADQCLNDFLDSCKKQDWYANTIIVLVADHGHELGLQNTFYFGREKYHIPLVVTGGALKPGFRNKQINNVVSQTIIPQLLLQAMNLDAKEFRWQSEALDTNGFAQYHYNNGFGRVNKSSECVSDNEGTSYFFKGDRSDSLRIKKSGRVFEQILIEDFLRK